MSNYFNEVNNNNDTQQWEDNLSSDIQAYLQTVLGLFPGCEWMIPGLDPSVPIFAEYPLELWEH